MFSKMKKKNAITQHPIQPETKSSMDSPSSYISQVTMEDSNNLSPDEILQLQRTHGNRFVLNLVGQKSKTSDNNGKSFSRGIKTLKQTTNTTIHRQPEENNLQNTYISPPISSGSPISRHKIGGNKTLQRDIKVTNIDFDPTADPEDAYRHGLINVANFVTNLFDLIQNDGTFSQPYQNQRNNVRGDFSDRANDDTRDDYEQPDFPRLIPAIREDIRGFYFNRGLAAFGGALRDALDGHIETALIENMQPSNHPMTGGERTAFDELITNAQAHGSVSKNKGITSSIPLDSLPGPLQTSVNNAYATLQEQNATWTIANFEPRFAFKNNGAFTFQATALDGPGSAYYQGNHTNNAGWLPAVAPLTPLQDMNDAILQQASPNLANIMTNGTGGIPQQTKIACRNEFIGLYNAHMLTLDNDDISKMVWEMYSAGVSSYIEFNMGGDISRLILDYVTPRVYVTAHYKWKDGYNPFFEVTGMPAL